MSEYFTFITSKYIPLKNIEKLVGTGRCKRIKIYNAQRNILHMKYQHVVDWLSIPTLRAVIVHYNGTSRVVHFKEIAEIMGYFW